MAKREQWRQAAARAVRRLAADRLAWPITRRAVTAAQHAQPEWTQVASHIPAAGHRLAGDDPPCFLFAGSLENRDAGVDLAQARARRDQQAVGQQPAQPGAVSVEGSPLGAAHGRDEVIPWRMHEKDPLAHAPILPLPRALRMPRRRRREGHRASPRRCPGRPFTRAAGPSLAGVDVSTWRLRAARAEGPVTYCEAPRECKAESRQRIPAPRRTTRVEAAS